MERQQARRMCLHKFVIKQAQPRPKKSHNAADSMGNTTQSFAVMPALQLPSNYLLYTPVFLPYIALQQDLGFARRFLSSSGMPKLL